MVSRWSCRPGPHDRLDPAPAAVAARPLDHLEGQPGDQRDAEDPGEDSNHQAGSPIGANTKIAMIITTSRKLVPHRGCSREYSVARSGVSSSGLVAGDRLVLGAVVLEHAPEVAHRESSSR